MAIEIAEVTDKVARNLPAIPPLENGDLLTRTEFERRYEAMPWLKKAELIEGVVYIGSPVRSEVHAQPHGLMVTLLGLYRLSTPGVVLDDNGTLRLDPDNEPQPDVMLRIDFGEGWRCTDQRR
jgi:putative restriction endonuclease